MHNRRVYIIYNPMAGQGSAADRMPRVRELLTRHNVEFEIRETERPGHATELAREAASGSWLAIVAAGGDGTANEVINGLMLARNDGVTVPPLGVLCVGRGNDFAHGAGVSPDFDTAVEALHSGVPRPIDIGLLRGGDYPDGRYFGNGIGVGFDTIVGFEAAKMKWIKGFAGYVIGALRTIFLFYRAPLLHFVYGDVDRTDPSIQVSVMNGQRMGGTFYMAPEADVADGALELCIAGNPTRREMLGLIVRYLKGTQAVSRHITVDRTRRVLIESQDHALAVHADGETICTAGSRLEVECIPTPLSIMVPAEA